MLLPAPCAGCLRWCLRWGAVGDHMNCRIGGARTQFESTFFCSNTVFCCTSTAFCYTGIALLQHRPCISVPQALRHCILLHAHCISAAQALYSCILMHRQCICSTRTVFAQALYSAAQPLHLCRTCTVFAAQAQYSATFTSQAL